MAGASARCRAAILASRTTIFGRTTLLLLIHAPAAQACLAGCCLNEASVAATTAEPLPEPSADDGTGPSTCTCADPLANAVEGAVYRGALCDHELVCESAHLTLSVCAPPLRAFSCKGGRVVLGLPRHPGWQADLDDQLGIRNFTTDRKTQRTTSL